MNNIIKTIEKKYIKTDIPKFRSGDTAEIKIKVKEGNRVRIQSFIGTIISIKKRHLNLNSSFTIRKISHGEGVERVFPMHSNIIKSIKILRKGDVRKSKIYYLRKLSGKSAKIKQLIVGKKDT